MGIVAHAAFSLEKGFVRLEGFTGFYGFLVAGETNILFFCEKQFVKITGMPHMTGQTALFAGDRFVRDTRGDIFIFMTLKAKGIACPGKQGRIFRGMGVMTGAAFPFFKGLMLYVAPGLKFRWFMAGGAKRAAFFNGPEGFFGFRRVMAFFTLEFGDIQMGTCSQEFGL